MRTYTNKRHGKEWQPHSDQEADFHADCVTRWHRVLGPAGSGSTTTCIIKVLDRLYAGMDGALVAPSFPLLRKDLWPLFQSWCPDEWVNKRQRYRLHPDWQPASSFELDFVCGQRASRLYVCSGYDPYSLHGPNLNFAFLNDPHRAGRYEELLRVADGRLRLLGPDSQQPQGWVAIEGGGHLAPLQFTGYDGLPEV